MGKFYRHILISTFTDKMQLPQQIIVSPECQLVTDSCSYLAIDKVLEVDSKATQQQIRDAYKK